MWPIQLALLISCKITHYHFKQNKSNLHNDLLRTVHLVKTTSFNTAVQIVVLSITDEQMWHIWGNEIWQKETEMLVENSGQW
jgi:hypothetical protein